MSLDAFKRLVSFLATVFVVVPIPVAVMNLLFSESRAYIVMSAVISLGIGVVLKIASRRLGADLGSGFRLVEYCFYVFSADTLVGFVHQFFADRALFESEALLNALKLVVAVAVLVVIKRTIDGVKARNLADQPQEVSNQRIL
jgi:hypothetical protein